jgi:hypothetical protein
VDDDHTQRLRVVFVSDLIGGPCEEGFRHHTPGQHLAIGMVNITYEAAGSMQLEGKRRG